MREELKLKLKIIKGPFAVLRMDRDAALPDWAFGGEFFSATRTRDELSLVMEEALVPEGAREIQKTEKGWAALQIAGQLDFGLVGILAGISTLLADAGISIFAVSTYDTDYILLKETDMEKAIGILEKNWYAIIR